MPAPDPTLSLIRRLCGAVSYLIDLIYDNCECGHCAPCRKAPRLEKLYAAARQHLRQHRPTAQRLRGLTPAQQQELDDKVHAFLVDTMTQDPAYLDDCVTDYLAKMTLEQKLDAVGLLDPDDAPSITLSFDPRPAKATRQEEHHE